MKFNYLLVLTFGVMVQLTKASADSSSHKRQDQSTKVKSLEQDKIVTLVDGVVYKGECANIEEIITNYMTNYEAERNGKREGYGDCLLRKGFVKLSNPAKKHNLEEDEKIMKLYMADIFLLYSQTVEGREMYIQSFHNVEGHGILKKLFQDSPYLIEEARKFYLPVMPDYDAKIATILSK
jgi:hypothetical protein